MKRMLKLESLFVCNVYIVRPSSGSGDIVILSRDINFLLRSCDTYKRQKELHLQLSIKDLSASILISSRSFTIPLSVFYSVHFFVPK